MDFDVHEVVNRGIEMSDQKPSRELISQWLAQPCPPNFTGDFYSLSPAKLDLLVAAAAKWGWEHLSGEWIRWPEKGR